MRDQIRSTKKAEEKAEKYRDLKERLDAAINNCDEVLQEAATT